MRFRMMTFGLAAVAVLVATSVVGATPVAGLRGHTAASASAATAAAHPLDPLTAEEIQRTFVTIKTERVLAPLGAGEVIAAFPHEGGATL